MATKLLYKAPEDQKRFGVLHWVVAGSWMVYGISMAELFINYDSVYTQPGTNAQR
jgi:hypothetical protein